ncbi:MAG: endonuclease MutS2, partial [Planctomycetes bacterium]|nr:endonuclease MutS2 [Planctomycetota bacterium]
MLRLVGATDRAEVERLQSETAEVRVVLADRFSFRLDGLPDIRAFLRGGGDPLSRILDGPELAAIGFVLERGRSLRSDLSRREDLPILRARTLGLPTLEELRETIESAIDPQGEVLSTASVELTRVRGEISRLDRELRRWCENKAQSSSIRKSLQETFVSVRNGRFVLAVRAEHRGRVRGVVHGESASGATLFIEPEDIVRRGDELADFHQREQHEIHRILAELTLRVHKQHSPILQTFETLVDLDVAVARGRFGEAFRAVRPVVSEGRQLVVAGARHPLLLWLERDASLPIGADSLASAVDRIVPLDLDLAGAAYQMVVTGPNTGGKTVALKTVGLFALMTTIGLPVPAQPGATIPLYDGVYADIGDEQSLEQSLSTFSAHMTVISGILHAATSRSLVLIDELGAGTDPLEGAALGESILERLYRRGTATLVTTHL